MDIAQQDTWIRERAYWLWEEEGRPSGRELDHWYRALQEIAGRAIANLAGSAPAKAKPRKTAAKPRTRKAQR